MRSLVPNLPYRHSPAAARCTHSAGAAFGFSKESSALPSNTPKNVGGHHEINVPIQAGFGRHKPASALAGHAIWAVKSSSQSLLEALSDDRNNPVDSSIRKGESS